MSMRKALQIIVRTLVKHNFLAIGRIHVESVQNPMILTHLSAYVAG
jgi:hypothetical protein